MRRTAAPLLTALVALAAASVAAAGERTCKTSIEGIISEITYDTGDDAVAQNRSFSERAWAMFGNDTCPGYVTLRAMTPDLTDAERGPFCLLYDPEEKTFTGFSQGERDRYLLCTESRTFCEKVNAGTDAALKLAGLGEDATAADAAPIGRTDFPQHSRGDRTVARGSCRGSVRRASARKAESQRIRATHEHERGAQSPHPVRHAPPRRRSAALRDDRLDRSPGGRSLLELVAGAGTPVHLPDGR